MHLTQHAYTLLTVARLLLSPASHAVLSAPLGHAIIREGVCDMDVPHYMLAVKARNRRLFGRRRRLWREWAAKQGPQYRCVCMCVCAMLIALS